MPVVDSTFLSLKIEVCVCGACLVRYSELPNQEAFFQAAKKSPRVICHFYRPTTRYCEIVDMHMERLAPKHMETRVSQRSLSILIRLYGLLALRMDTDCAPFCLPQFVKINAEKAPYLVEKLNIWMMPTLVLIKDGQTVHHVRGFDEFGGSDSFGSDAFAYLMSSYKVLNYDGPRPDSPTSSGKGRRGVNGIRMAVGSSVREGLQERRYDDDEY